MTYDLWIKANRKLSRSQSSNLSLLLHHWAMSKRWILLKNTLTPEEFSVWKDLVIWRIPNTIQSSNLVLINFNWVFIWVVSIREAKKCLIVTVDGQNPFHLGCPKLYFCGAKKWLLVQDFVHQLYHPQAHGPRFGRALAQLRTKLLSSSRKDAAKFLRTAKKARKDKTLKSQPLTKDFTSWVKHGDLGPCFEYLTSWKLWSWLLFQIISN